MKTKIALLSLMVVAIGGHVFAQEEIDDMYFTSKDRAAYNAAHQSEFSSLSRRVIETESTVPVINPTDSYSARGTNPEYISGSKVGTNATASNNVSYFSANYQPTSVNQALSSNNTYNNYAYNGFGSPMGYNRMGMGMYPSYGMGGFSPWGYNSMSMMNPYYDPWMMNGMGMGGYYPSGLSFGYGMGWGSPSSMFWNSFNSPYYGFGMSSFYGGFGNPYFGYGYNSFYSPFGFGNPYYGYGYGYGYGSSVAVVSDRVRPQSARGQEIDRYYSSDNRGGIASGGRVASEQYYNNTWRNDSYQSTNGAWNTRTSQSSNAWNTNSNNWNNNNGWNNNGWGNNNSGWGGRSSSFSTGGGGGGFSGGGGGGGGGSRRGRD